MANRWADMDSRPAQRWSPRLLCAAAGLLCAIGVLSGAVVRVSGAAHHHAHTVAAVVTVTDGHSNVLRGDHPVVAATGATATRVRVHTDLTTTSVSSASIATIDSVRTRGPPAQA